MSGRDEPERDRGAVVVLLTIAAIAIYLLSQGRTPPKLPLLPNPLAAKAGTKPRKPLLPLLRRRHPDPLGAR